MKIKEPFLPNKAKGTLITTSAVFLIPGPCTAIPTSYRTNRGRINKKLLARLFERW
ncbi:MAG: hypothetical protein HZA47_11745 [Planctomycetes bacterium]|nr:hypothetical protein [Planctomycetota bacterium]